MIACKSAPGCLSQHLAPIFLTIASCILLLVSCAPQPLTVTREPVVLQLVAAGSCETMADELAEGYEESHPWITVEIVGVFNSATTEQILLAGEADLALLSWMGKRSEENLWAQPFARDGVAVIVHPDMPFAETGLAHLQEIYWGRVQEWGGVVLTVVSREEGSGDRALFENRVLGARDVTRTAVVMASGESVVEYVARTPGAIGYVSSLLLNESDAVRALPVEGVLPAPDTIADGSYLLARPLYLATVAEPTGAAREFAQWALGTVQGR
ncbi:MAG: substrate-binding domain-containing protein [Chloroflexota bacterium]|nr:substrate-binding domain-containing protein [Chloroflexota bacterium]